MNNLPPETEGQALRREFRETAWDLTRDVVSLPKRVIVQHYDYLRNGCDGLEPPASRLRAALLVGRDELAKASGGAVGLTHSPLAALAGAVVSNLVINTVLAKDFWREKGKPIFPRHAERLQQRATNKLNP
ncbi:MAG: hypothetical protein KBA75_05530 [Alphaproteobacteria bacterium]|nr:hypothetical protein [Alphaproteobacteria bacterium]